MIRWLTRALFRGGPMRACPGFVCAGCLAVATTFVIPARADGISGSLADSLDFLGSRIRQTEFAILVCSLDRGDTLVSFHPDRRMIPGSNAKLFTTGSFLRQFGPSYRGTTLLLARGKVSTGDRGRKIRFNGDLVLRGSGLPDVTQLLAPGSRGLLDSLVTLLRAQGLEKFEGTLWVDGSRFAPDPYGPGWAYDDLPLWYGAPVNAILANGNAATLAVTGTSQGARISLEPPEAPLVVHATVAVADTGTPPRLTIARTPGTHLLEVSGVVPRGGTFRKQVSVPDPDSAAALELLGSMRRAGISVRASARVLPPQGGEAGGKDSKDVAMLRAFSNETGSVAPAPAWSRVRKDQPQPVLALESPTAAEIVGEVNAVSMNPEAEALLRQLDPAASGKRRERGLTTVMEHLAKAGIDTLDLSLVDGSGLSPMDLVTPRAIVQWLTVLDQDSVAGAPFREGLARPGGRGTLRTRLAGLEGGAALRGKSGTLTNVSALSGYVTTAAGERLVFSILSNGNRGSVAAAKDAEDRLVALLSRYHREVRAPSSSRPIGIPR